MKELQVYIELKGNWQLALQKESFHPEQTRCFFEGLLPEGFSRKAVANWMLEMQ